MKIASWNVNSIRARYELVVDWLKRHEPDVLCLQETKVVDADFPTLEFQMLGYSAVMAGQRTYNGVAILSRIPVTNATIGLEGEGADADKRSIAVTVAGVRVLSVYVPNGKDVTSESFRQKIEWLGRLRRTLEATASAAGDIALCGDFNIAREARDVFDPERMKGNLHFHPDEHAALNGLCAFGLVDAYRLHHPEGGRYSWWDYRGASVRLNQGLRIDYIFVTKSLAARCVSADIDADVRLQAKPSDHAPVFATFRDLR